MVHFDMDLFLRIEVGSHAYFWQVLWWIRLNQEFRFLRRGEKELEQEKPKSQNATDWGRENKINKPFMHRQGGRDERQGGHGRKIEEPVNNWISNEKQGHWGCTNSKRGNLGMTESRAGVQCELELSGVLCLVEYLEASWSSWRITLLIVWTLFLGQRWVFQCNLQCFIKLLYKAVKIS